MKHKLDTIKTPVFYIINYFLCLFSILNVDFIISGFMVYIAVTIILIVTTSYMVKQWYHSVLCMLPSLISSVYSLVYVYVAYNSDRYANVYLYLSSIELMITFMFIHFFTLSLFYIITIVTVFKYKKYRIKKSKLRIPIYILLILSYVAVTVFTIYAYNTDYLVSQTILSFLPLIAGPTLAFFILPGKIQ